MDEVLLVLYCMLTRVLKGFLFEWTTVRLGGTEPNFLMVEPVGIGEHLTLKKTTVGNRSPTIYLVVNGCLGCKFGSRATSRIRVASLKKKD